MKLLLVHREVSCIRGEGWLWAKAAPRSAGTLNRKNNAIILIWPSTGLSGNDPLSARLRGRAKRLPSFSTLR